MISRNVIQWHLYIAKWLNGQFSVHLSSRAPETINWCDLLDAEGDPSSAEVRCIQPALHHHIAFLQELDQEFYYPHMLSESPFIGEMFAQSTDVVWPEEF